MTFYQRLQQTIQARGSNLCVGLDPDPAKIPAAFAGRSDPVAAFLREVIEAVSDVACAFKPNFAFFEALGERGWRLLHEVVAAVPDDMITIADAKRGDIGNTARAYARAIYDELGFDCVTLNPLMGHDAMEPFLAYPERGAFALVLTSNPGAADFQLLPTEQGPLYLRMLRKVLEWNEADNLGAVVGATRPELIAAIRREAPRLPLLLPGIGSQGGDLAATLAAAAPTADALFMVNVSRAVIYPTGTGDFQTLVREQALDYRDRIAAALTETP